MPCGGPGTSLIPSPQAVWHPLRTLNKTGQEQEFRAGCRIVVGTANSPVYTQGKSTLASGVTEKGAELDRLPPAARQRLQALMQPSSRTSKWSQRTETLPHLCQLSINNMNLKQTEVWRIRNADRWRYVGWSIGNTMSAPKNHPTRFHWVAKVENTAFALFLLRRQPLQGSNGLSGDLLISHHDSLWTRGTFCEWPNHRDETDFFMWSNPLPQHRHHQLVSSSCIFFCQWRCSVWPLVCQTEGKGLLRRKLWIVSWQCTLALGSKPWHTTRKRVMLFTQQTRRCTSSARNGALTAYIWLQLSQVKNMRLGTGLSHRNRNENLQRWQCKTS